MLFFGTGSFPGTSATDLRKKIIDELTTNPYPDFIKRTYIFCVKPEGLTLNTLWDIEKGKEEEGLKDIMTRILSLSRSIEGLTMNITPALSVEELFSILSKLGVTEEELSKLGATQE